MSFGATFGLARSDPFVRLRLRVPRERESQASTSENSILFPRQSGTFAPSGARLGTLETKLERTLECNRHGEISGSFRLHAKNLAASTELHTLVGQVRNSHRHLHCGTLRNQRSAGKQNAPKADVLRTSLHFLVGQLEYDRHVQRVANIPPFLPPVLQMRRVHGSHGCSEATPERGVAYR